MKFSLHIDKEREEEVIVYARQSSELIETIRRLAEGGETRIVGYFEDDIVVLPPEEVACFISQDDKVYAVWGDKRYLVKKRLYQVAELLGRDYIKINQSCIANTKQISRFTASIGGSLDVVFKCGYRDFVSRRELKAVKERIGIA